MTAPTAQIRLCVTTTLQDLGYLPKSAPDRAAVSTVGDAPPSALTVPLHTATSADVWHITEARKRADQIAREGMTP